MPKLTYSLPIYPFHIDAMGHVNNIVYIQWMEIGRVLLLEAIAMPIEEVVSAGLGPVLIETHISYKLPLYLGDKVSGSIWLSQLRGVSAILEFEFFNQAEECVALGSQKGIFIDLKSKRPKRLNKEQRERFLRYLITD